MSAVRRGQRLRCSYRRHSLFFLGFCKKICHHGFLSRISWVSGEEDDRLTFDRRKRTKAFRENGTEFFSSNLADASCSELKYSKYFNSPRELTTVDRILFLNR